ncbi:MAG: methyltransferase domain-containing protein [Candidatus Falkowbacteria bacterium]
MIIPGLANSVLLDTNLIISKARITERMKVANLGCGASGLFVFPVASMIGKKGKVYAVDILKTVLERISRVARQENFTNIETIWSNLEVYNATKIESGSVDVALLINVLYQSQHRPQILREAIRLIKKDGYMLVVEWKNVSSPLGPPLEERVRKELLLTAAKKLGLVLEDEFEAGHYHYGLLFTKI